MRRRSSWLLALVIVAGGALVGCGDDEPKADSGESAQVEEKLGAQREAVRELALQVGPALADSVSGSLTFLRGSWAGCASADQWSYRNFKYRVAGRIDATDLSAESLEPLQQVLRDEGFELSSNSVETDEPPGTDGVRKDLAVGLRIYLDDSFALISFAGSCVDVPEADREAWGSRGEPDKNLVPPAASSSGE